MRLIDADALSKLVGEPIEVFLRRLDLKLPPTVDAEPVRHGQWIVNDNPHTCKCSCCESVELTDWALDQAKYCPHCGAKMEAKDGETD